MYEPIAELIRASRLIFGAAVSDSGFPRQHTDLPYANNRPLCREPRSPGTQDRGKLLGALIVSVLIGTRVLAFFGVSLPVVQVGGGPIVSGRTHRARFRRDRDEYRCSLVGIHPRLHRRTDRMEWCERTSVNYPRQSALVTSIERVDICKEKAGGASDEE
jgi:hypothetical protein